MTSETNNDLSEIESKETNETNITNNSVENGNKINIKDKIVSNTQTTIALNNKTIEKVVVNSDSTIINPTEKLKARAERFGAIVSDKMKKMADKEKLMKRKERFGAITVATKATVKTSATDPTDQKSSKKAITFSTKDDDRKRQRLERFKAIS